MKTSSKPPKNLYKCSRCRTDRQNCHLVPLCPEHAVRDDTTGVLRCQRCLEKGFVCTTRRNVKGEIKPVLLQCVKCPTKFVAGDEGFQPGVDGILKQLLNQESVLRILFRFKFEVLAENIEVVDSEGDEPLATLYLAVWNKCSTLVPNIISQITSGSISSQTPLHDTVLRVVNLLSLYEKMNMSRGFSPLQSLSLLSSPRVLQQLPGLLNQEHIMCTQDILNDIDVSIAASSSQWPRQSMMGPEIYRKAEMQIQQIISSLLVKTSLPSEGHVDSNPLVDPYGSQFISAARLAQWNGHHEIALGLTPSLSTFASPQEMLTFVQTPFGIEEQEALDQEAEMTMLQNEHVTQWPQITAVNLTSDLFIPQQMFVDPTHTLIQPLMSAPNLRTGTQSLIPAQNALGVIQASSQDLNQRQLLPHRPSSGAVQSSYREAGQAIESLVTINSNINNNIIHGVTPPRSRDPKRPRVSQTRPLPPPDNDD